MNLKEWLLVFIGVSASFVLVVHGCKPLPTGNLDQDCNPDGSCNGENLYCNTQHECSPVQKIEPKRCYYESECFCMNCADKCGAAGVQTCAYSDTSVWGSKPAVCECK